MSKVVIYHPWIYLKGGAEKVWLEYSERSKHDIKLHSGYVGSDTFQALIPITHHATKCLGSVTVKRNLFNSLLSLLAIVTTHLSIQKNDILLISSEGFGDFVGLLRLCRSKKTIAFAHTPLKLVYDDTTLASTKARLSAPAFFVFANIIKPLYKIFNRAIWKRYDFIVANSHETKRRILNGKLAEENKIVVIHPGAKLVERNESKPISDKYKQQQFLIAGRIMIQKNIEAGIEAFLEAKLNNATLVVAGHCDAKSQTYLSMLKAKYAGADVNSYTNNDAKNHVNPKVSFISNPNDTQYSDLFDESYCVIFTPLNEDWGIVPVEAMANAMPVIAFNRGGPAESVIHEGTGLLCELNTKSMKNAIRTISTCGEKRYVEYCRQAQKHAKQFTWQDFTQKLDNVISKVSQ
jgi:glycosyltransferase involved in cell wall biosynthesis